MIPDVAHLKREPKREESAPGNSFKKILSKKQNKEEASATIIAPYLPPFIDAPILAPENRETSEILAVNGNIEKYSAYLDELADEIAMTLTLQEEISTLKTTYQKEGSPFNHLEIFIDHYSTAPSSFNIELYGQPNAAEILAKGYPQLIERLASIMPGHQFNISPPFIRSETFNKYPRKEKNREIALKKSLKI